jgi:hypothetical protein
VPQRMGTEETCCRPDQSFIFQLALK